MLVCLLWLSFFVFRNSLFAWFQFFQQHRMHVKKSHVPLLQYHAFPWHRQNPHEPAQLWAIDPSLLLVHICGIIYHFISVTWTIAFWVSPVTENAFVWLKIAEPTFRCSAPYKCTYLLTYLLTYLQCLSTFCRPLSP